MKVVVAGSYRELSSTAAAMVRDAVMRRPRLTLGLPTGRTPVGMYDELVRMYRSGMLDLSGVVTFNLDEYYPMDPRDPRSFHAFMRTHLFDHVNVPPDHIHLPDGSAPDPAEACARYEREIERAGGIDLIILGIGRTGHIGFNEPGSPRWARTRLVRLTDETIRANFGTVDAATPRSALSMGTGTIMEARDVILLASGPGKAEIAAKAATGPVTTAVPASILQEHPSVTVILDAAAASLMVSGGRATGGRCGV
ncbi:MAG: glucosamine-6-phosphate deaminase [Ignavibacteriales bacterium]